MRLIYRFILIVFSSVILIKANAQKNDSTTKVNNGKEIWLDTLKPKKDSATAVLAKKDSVLKKKHDPHKATIRSAILPGWGQAYNRQYWKIPIVYGALAVPASLFVYNNTWYQRTKEAYDILVNGGDTSKIHPDLKNVDAASMQSFRKSIKPVPLSITFFMWLSSKWQWQLIKPGEIIPSNISIPSPASSSSTIFSITPFSSAIRTLLRASNSFPVNK